MQRLTCFTWSIYNTVFHELFEPHPDSIHLESILWGSSTRPESTCHPYFDFSVQQDKHESPGDTWLVVVCPSTELMRWNFEISSWVLPWETHPWTCFPLRLNFNELEAELQIMILLDLDSGQVPQTASQLTLKQYCWWFHCIEFFKFNIRNRLFWLNKIRTLNLCVSDADIVPM